MTRVTSRRYRFSSLLIIWVTAFLLVACGSDSNKTPPAPVNQVPTISGSPAKTIALGQSYEFIPAASDVDSTHLIYSIKNKPTWATFDPSTGRLYGTPNAEGVYNDISITVTDRLLSATLVAFNIVVTSQASLSSISVVATEQGNTPFINFLTLQGMQINNVKKIEYIINPKPNTVSKAVRVNFSRSALQSRDYIPDTETITLPVYGLYAGHQNLISLTFWFDDTSSQTIPFTLKTNEYKDPNKIYDHPVILKKRKADSALGFDFFIMKSSAGAPIIVDTDGELRWTAIVPEVTNSASTIFHNNAFVIGDQKSVNVSHLELDGKVTQSKLIAPSYTNFHHNIDSGKYGYLGEFDAEDSSIKNIESIIADFDLSGSLLRTWDFSEILFNYMSGFGDDPSLFIRAGVDWFHSNAAVYDQRDDSLIVSSRENFVIKIDYETNDIIWILGDPTKYWYTFPSLRAKAVKLDAGIYPIGQHAVSINSDGQLMLFNNGLGSLNQPSGAPKGESRSYSAVSTYEIDPHTLIGREVWRFSYNESILSDICSSVYEGESKSLLISYAVASKRTTARLVGLDQNKEVVFDFEYPSSVCRSSWNAVPIGLDKMNIL